MALLALPRFSKCRTRGKSPSFRIFALSRVVSGRDGPRCLDGEDHEQHHDAQFQALREACEPIRELSEAELNTVYGGKVMQGDLQIMKYLDKASPKL